MTTYFVGGELDSANVLSPYNVYESGDAGSQSGYTRGAIKVVNVSLGFSCDLINPSTGLKTGATGTIWTHFNAWIASQNRTDYTHLTYYNDAGTAVFRLQMGGNNLFQAQMWSGSAWTNVGSPFVYVAQDYSCVFDYKLTIGSSGNFRAVVRNLEVANIDFDSSAIGNVARAVWTSNGGDLYVGQIIIASYSTIGHTVRRRTPSGNGTNTAWAGDWTGVDEFGLNDADGISTQSAGQKETLTANALTATESGKIIKAVAVAVRGRIDDDAVPRNIKAVIRVGSTDYESPNVQGVNNYTFGSGLAIWDNDPSTSAPWNNIANVNGEFGVKSDT